MKQTTTHFLKERIYLVHSWLIRAGEAVTIDQFVHAFSQDAPPIGWHLWHMARFADRLQAKLALVTDGSAGLELWHRDEIPSQWNLSSDRLGVFESGMGQAHADALATTVRAGQIAIMDYADAVFKTCNDTTGKLADSDFERVYYGVRDFGYDGETGKVWATEPEESTVAQDLIFHASHGCRHMGMMEALRGLLGTAGTLSV